MRKRTGIAATVLMAGTLLAGGLQGTLAQDATPIVPDPAECVVEPRTVDNAVDLFLSGDYVPDEEIIAGNLPTGESASDEIVEATNATLRQFFACANNNDLLAMMAVMTDDGAQFFGPEATATEQQIRDFFEAQEIGPLPDDEREVFLPLTDVVVLPDGRVGALSSSGNLVYVIFEEVDGMWLADAVYELDALATPTAS